MKGRRYQRLSRAFCTAALGVSALCLVPSAAAAAERVQDGGFEASTCDATQCADPAWMEATTAGFANSTGPICRSGTGSGNADCNGGGSAPFSGSTWARLGAGYKAAEPMSSGGVISSLEQTVSIPTAPATLGFRLRIIDAAGPIGGFTVEVGDTQVFTATDASPGFAAYAPVSIDLSSFAGTTPELKFEAFSSHNQIGALDSFDVDAISLTTVDPPDPRCAKLRAKLRKAKGKKNKKQRRKLRKKLKKKGC